ncbi:formylglycine-generating enzyme family protein [Crossiella sp. NPDC003009]
MKLIAVPPGQVTLTDRRTQQTWQVDLAPYQIATHQVTQSQYAEVTGTRPSTTKGENLPVESVSWRDAITFCNKLSHQERLTPAYHLDSENIEWDKTATGYRLPTEAEWQYACQAGTKAPRYGNLDDIAWHRDNSNEQVHPVGEKQPNAWGLHDMLGNVWEWCWDLYDPEVYGSYRVLRGGGWLDEHWSVRAGVRRKSHPTYAIDDVGFRIARNSITISER